MQHKRSWTVYGVIMRRVRKRGRWAKSVCLGQKRSSKRGLGWKSIQNGRKSEKTDARQKRRSKTGTATSRKCDRRYFYWPIITVYRAVVVRFAVLLPVTGARIACRRYYYCRRGLNGPCTPPVERHRESEADGRQKIVPTSDAF